MNAYPITEDIYRVPGGFGQSGENYGGILVANDPPILIGASGGRTLVTNLVQALNDLNLVGNLKIIYTSVLWEELVTAKMINEQLPTAEFHVHEDLWNSFAEPRSHFLTNRYHANPDGDIKKQAKKLPENIGNVFKLNKLSNIETDKTKILIIPSPGPQKGHIYVYSRDHKLLCTGVVLGLTPSNSKLYYLDRTGSLPAYTEALKFLDQANADTVAPAYDEPYFTTHSSINTIEMNSSLESAKEIILRLCVVQAKSFKDLFKEYIGVYAEKYNTDPYDELQFNATVLYKHLSELVDEKLVIKENDQYRRN